jgi:hypothetical protein
MKKNRSDIRFDAALRKEIEELEPPFKELGTGMMARLDFHRNLILRNYKKYYKAGVTFSLAIPIGSALITWMMSESGKEAVHTLTNLPIETFGILLTILTIVNSVLRPAEEYLSSSHMLVRLHDWEMSLALEIPKSKDSPELLNHLFEIKDRELSKMGDALADSVFPQNVDKGFTPPGGRNTEGRR